MYASLLVAGILVLMFGCDKSYAQKTIEACDREIRSSNAVVLKTPRGIVSGNVCLDDGDSLLIGPTWLRFQEFDTPNIGRGCLKEFDELSPRCSRTAGGIEALAQLSSLLEGGATCSADKIDGYNRWLAQCTLNDGRSVAKEMIAVGFACATKGGAQYYGLSQEARKLGKGLWAEQWNGKRGIFPSALCPPMNREILQLARPSFNPYAKR